MKHVGLLSINLLMAHFLPFSKWIFCLKYIYQFLNKELIKKAFLWSQGIKYTWHNHVVPFIL